MPLLCISVQDDPLREGLTSTLDRGNGNLVGVHSYLPDGISQQLRMLQQLKPDVKRLGVLFKPTNATHKRLLSSWQESAAGQKIEIVFVPVVGPSDLEKVITDAMSAKAEIAIGLLGADTYAMRKEIAASAYRFPIAMDTPGGYTQMGGVATIGVDIVPLYKRGAIELMVPMLKGTSPSGFPWIGPKEAVMKVNETALEGFGLSTSTR